MKFLMTLAMFATAASVWGQAKKPIALYNHVGKYVLYVDPEKPDMILPAFTLADHTQVDRSLPFNNPVRYHVENNPYCSNCRVADLADPLQDLWDADSHRDDFQNGANGYKYHILGEFRYRESEDKDGLPAICVPIPGAHTGSPPPSEIEACYRAFPRDPSVLDMIQQKGSNKNAMAGLLP